MRSKPLVRETAQQLLNIRQTLFSFWLFAVLFVFLLQYPHGTLLVLVALSMLFWLAFVGQKAVLASACMKFSMVQALASITDPCLPSYTVFIPLYKEAQMLPKLVQSIGELNYPKDRIQVLLLLEEDDTQTRQAAENLDLPVYFKVVVVPPGGPKTKPNALNVGLAQATGDLCVIYDAEDRPEPDQMLKAVAGFHKSPSDVACLQARLAFWNGNSSWVTRFYWAEYVVHFEWVLGGLTRLGMIPPLGGTSNHFITARLREVAIDPNRLPDIDMVGGWDPWNVTEDAELAGALALRGYKVQMIDSVTYEEATAKLSIADNQRRRWLKGYVQTGLVYARHPFKYSRAMGRRNYICYILMMLGTPLSLWLNPFFWGGTIIYFATHTTVVAQLFPLPLYYWGIILMVAGNLLVFYQLVMACLHRQGYGNVKYMLLAPIWWTFTSWSAYMMLIELIRPSKRHLWHKTQHGHDLHKEETVQLGITGT